MKKKLMASAAGAAVAASLGLGATQFAQADTDSPAPTPPTSSATTPGEGAPMHGREGRGHAAKGFRVPALATKLGLPEATVSDALEEVRDQMRTTRPSTDATSPADKEAVREERRDALASALAAELDIDETTVSEALSELQDDVRAVRSAAEAESLDGAVTGGTLTRDEADTVQKAIDAGVVTIRGGHGRR